MNPRHVCCVCHEARECEKHFTDAGWCCVRCLRTADRIHTVYRIGGIRFVEILKEVPKKKTAVVAAAS